MRAAAPLVQLTQSASRCSRTVSKLEPAVLQHACMHAEAPMGCSCSSWQGTNELGRVGCALSVVTGAFVLNHPRTAHCLLLSLPSPFFLAAASCRALVQTRRQCSRSGMPSRATQSSLCASSTTPRLAGPFGTCSRWRPWEVGGGMKKIGVWHSGGGGGGVGWRVVIAGACVHARAGA